MVTTNSFIAIVLLLAASGFCVAAESALLKVRTLRLESATTAGRTAAGSLRVQGDLESYPGACRPGKTVASPGLGRVGESAVAGLPEPMLYALGVPGAVLHTAASITGLLIFSSQHRVIGKRVPKAFAPRQPEPVSIRVAHPLHFSCLVVWPLNFLLGKASRAILSMFSVEHAGHGEVCSGEGIKGMVATSKAHGEIHHQQADRLHNPFESGQRHVGRVKLTRLEQSFAEQDAAPDKQACKPEVSA